jgi:hypothetical protein
MHIIEVPNREASGKQNAKEAGFFMGMKEIVPRSA